MRNIRSCVKPSFARAHAEPGDSPRQPRPGPEAIHRALLLRRRGGRPGEKLLAALIERGIALQAVVICGKNERLKTDIENLARSRTRSVRVQVRGYVTNLADYIAASDIVVGKSGPNQVFETLVQCRPIVISSFLANEKIRRYRVIRNKLGWLTRSPQHLATLLQRLEAQPAVLRRYQANIEAMKLRSGTPEICEFLAGLARRSVLRKRRPWLTPCESSGTAWLRREKPSAAGSRKPRSCGAPSGRRRNDGGERGSARPRAGGPAKNGGSSREVVSLAGSLTFPP